MFQTRSETTGLNQFPTLRAAFEASEIDKSIWKISFNDSDGTRIRLIRHNDSNFWLYAPL